eukprot:GHVP01054582.1.p1 GENE.GHVP01054582.1~~GHVP01054582.1.p1  ORF type:complete len:322 (+),score=30.10 GHVP01054582.1:660-1625(+)
MIQNNIENPQGERSPTDEVEKDDEQMCAENEPCDDEVNDEELLLKETSKAPRKLLFFPPPSQHEMDTSSVSQPASVGKCVLLKPIIATAEAVCLLNQLDIFVDKAIEGWKSSSRTNRASFTANLNHSLVRDIVAYKNDRFYLLARNPYILATFITIKAGAKCFVNEPQNLIYAQARLRKPVFSVIGRIVGQVLTFGDFVVRELADLQFYFEVDKLLSYRKGLCLSDLCPVKATNAERARQKLNTTKIHGFSLSSTDKKAYKNKLRKTQQKAKESIESAINHTRPTEKGLHSLFTRYLDYALEDRKSPLTTKNFRGPKGPRC